MTKAFLVAVALFAPILAGEAKTDAGVAVRSIAIVSGAKGAELQIGTDAAVAVSDFKLTGPQRVVVDLQNAVLGVPAQLYDRVQRGAVVNVKVAQYRANVVRVVLELSDARDYEVVKDGNTVRVVVNGATDKFKEWRLATAVAADDSADVPASAEEKAQAEVLSFSLTKRPVTAKRVTVSYQDADVRDVLSAFAGFSGRTIIAGKDVTGTITAEIRDQPWELALKAILVSQGFVASEDSASGIIVVENASNIRVKAQQEPLAVRLIPINYANAHSMANTVKTMLSKECVTGQNNGAGGAAAGVLQQCLTRGSAVADTTTNTLIITEVASRVDELMGYIKSLDIRTPQVTIKAKLIFVNRTNIQELGISYDLGKGTQQFFSQLVQRTDPSTLEPIDTNGDGVPDALGGGKPYEGDRVLLGGNTLSAIANANQRVTSPALSLVYSTALGKYQLTSFLDALQEQRLADLQAEPSVTTLDNQKAQIVVGQEIPIRVIDAGTSVGGGATQNVPRASVQLKEVGIILEVTPHITNNRQILMKVHAENSDAQLASTDVGFIFGKQRADNQLLVGDGQTAIIGGLTVTQTSKSRSGIPFLMNLPIIGRLFGTTRSGEEKRDLLILITPHITDGNEPIPEIKRGDK
jgi:type IV pilus assembly protein PilQ